MWFKDGTEETFPSWVFPVRFLSRAVDKYLFVWRLIDLLKLMDDIWNLSLSFQAFVATGTNLSLQFFPANLHGDQRQVPTREYVDFERETGKVGQVQDTLTLTFTLHLLLCSTTAGEITNFNIRCIWKHLCCLSHALTWLLDSFNTFFHNVKLKKKAFGETRTSLSALLLSVPLLLYEMKMTVQTTTQRQNGDKGKQLNKLRRCWFAAVVKVKSTVLYSAEVLLLLCLCVC